MKGCSFMGSILNNSAYNNDDYIALLIEKLKNVNDPELSVLVYRLIEERNNYMIESNIDSLSGLNNRRILKDVNSISGLLMIDIDDFKIINDTYGHDVGDFAIKQIASIIKNHIRSTDYACRYGGDEFLIAFSSCPEDVIKTRAEEIRKCVSDDSSLSNIKATVSIGVAIKKNNNILEDLIKEADNALYLSKRSGKNQIRRG